MVTVKMCLGKGVQRIQAGFSESFDTEGTVFVFTSKEKPPLNAELKGSFKNKRS